MKFDKDKYYELKFPSSATLKNVIDVINAFRFCFKHNGNNKLLRHMNILSEFLTEHGGATTSENTIDG